MPQYGYSGFIIYRMVAMKYLEAGIIEDFPKLIIIP